MHHKGSCLCGNVQFEIISQADILKIYQCHCSLCKKQSGTSSNSATLVHKKDFRFISGEEHISKWQKDTGFSSHFCRTCGSPVPNLVPSLGLYWIPVGLLTIDINSQEQSKLNIEVVSHFCTSTQSSWHQLNSSPNSNTVSFEGLPDVDTIKELLDLN